MNRFMSIWLIVTGMAIVGCAPEELDTTYGQRRSLAGRDSVNGTAVLGEMFKKAGFRVNGWRRLSPKLEEYEVIVWFPDNYEPPSKEHRQFLEDWLGSESGRTLVYVGRDYDAAATYWQSVLPSVPPEQAMEVSRRLATMTSEQAKARAAINVDEDYDWFTLEKVQPQGRVMKLSGPWSKGINSEEAEMYLNTSLASPTEDQNTAWRNGESATFKPLLEADQGPLVTKVTLPEWGSSQLLVVANGSFLLNLPLANREHRTLAVKLISACGRPGKAVFLESDANGLKILAEDPDNTYPTGLEVFTVWPLGIIVLHLTALGILCCFTAYPIFGRPREVALSSDASTVRAATYKSGYYAAGSSTVDVSARRTERSHFGKHIDALGELLEKTNDRAYAIERVKYYHEHVKRESGVSHQQTE
ncbi:MAG: DUF4350 domain-containing protein [Pirellulaceae bacterium]|jgi:hypothetical protein|nr:DUF4350 domain-containing protein [Pirellulaceae bacterium]